MFCHCFSIQDINYIHESFINIVLWESQESMFNSLWLQRFAETHVLGGGRTEQILWRNKEQILLSKSNNNSKKLLSHQPINAISSRSSHICTSTVDGYRKLLSHQPINTISSRSSHICTSTVDGIGNYWIISLYTLSRLDHLIYAQVL